MDNIELNWDCMVSDFFVPELWPLILHEQCQVVVVRLVSPQLYNLGSSDLVNTIIMVSLCQPGICHLTVTSIPWSTDFVKFTSNFCD